MVETALVIWVASHHGEIGLLFPPMLAANLLPVMGGGGCNVLLRSGSITLRAFHGRGNWAAITGIGRWLLPFYLRMHHN
jgi:hypothetical protein